MIISIPVDIADKFAQVCCVVPIYVLDELRDWDVPLAAIKFIYSFLCNRQIRVKIDGHLSQPYNPHN